MKKFFSTFLCFAFFFASSVLAKEMQIKGISIEGNNRIGSEAIANVLSTKVNSKIDSTQVQRDVKRIFGMGYFKNVTVKYNDESDVLIFVVEEKTVIREVVFKGNDNEDTEDLEAKIKTKAFSYVDQSQIREDVEVLRKYYDEEGFYLADISTELEDISGNEARLVFQIEENQEVFVREINFVGNKKFTDDELKSVMQTKEKGFFSWLSGSGQYKEELFAFDRQQLRDFYGSRGYIRSSIGAPRVQLSPDRQSLAITITVKEGDVYSVKAVSLMGEFIKPKDELEDMLKLKAGERVNTRNIQEDIRNLSLAYNDEGYAYANVIPRDSYDEKSKTVSIVYSLDPGPKVYIERIEFKGNESTRDKVLRREMAIAEGDLFSATKLRESQEAVNRLALFEEVNFNTPRGSSDNLMKVVVEISEKSTGSFSIGAGFNTLESFQVIGTIQKRNLFGYGVDLSLQARVGGRTQAFNLQYRDEYFLDSKWGLTVNAFNIERRFVDFERTARGGNIGFDYPIYTRGLKRIRAGFTYGLSDQKLSDIRSTVEPLFDDGLTSSFTLSASRDTRNRVFEPSKGSFLRLSQEFAGNYLGGDHNFTKSEFEGRWFLPFNDDSTFPIFGGSVFAFRLAGGYVAPLQSGDRVPLFERYFPGGILSIRGFDFGSLGPDIGVATSTDSSGFTTTEFRVGGNKQLIFNAEWIFPIIRAANIKGVFFFDMGNAFDKGESIFTLAGQRQSIGFGIRWFSPIGPLRFEWGWPLDKKEDESGLVFDFTIGSLF